MKLDAVFRRRVYREVLGIATGDVVTTSYGRGSPDPYEVWAILGPAYWELDYSALCVRDYPVMSLILVRPGVMPEKEHQLFYINEVRCEEGAGVTSRYFSGGDEVFVEKPGQRPAMELPGIFEDEDYEVTQPYRFQEGVDYRAGDVLNDDEQVWHCECCELDFNAEKPEPDSIEPPWCPACRRPALALIAFLEGKS